MVGFPPYFADSAWYGRWIESLHLGHDIAKSILIANEKAAPREFARCRIADVEDKEMLLSMAVEGGARKLKNRENIETLRLSDHGNWRHVHLKAMEACYGRKPFFIHLFPYLKALYRNEELKTLDVFNTEAHKIVVRFLLGNINVSEFNLFPTNPVLMERGKEIAGEIKRDFSVIDAIMNFGPEAIIGIFSLYIQQESE